MVAMWQDRAKNSSLIGRFPVIGSITFPKIDISILPKTSHIDYFNKNFYFNQDLINILHPFRLNAEYLKSMGPNARGLQLCNRRLYSSRHDGYNRPPLKLKPESTQAENMDEHSNFLQLLLISYILNHILRFRPKPFSR